MSPGSLTDTQRETLAVFDGPGEPKTTPEVADRLDMGRRSTYGRLERLVEHGALDTKKVGANARVWWRPLRSSPSATAEDGAEHGPGDADTLLGLLVDAVEEYALFTLSPEGTVQTWNEGVREMTGYEGEEVLGEHLSTLYTDDDREADVPAEHLAAAIERGETADEGWRVRKDGSRFWARLTVTAIWDERGDLQGFATVVRDMTARREREHAIRRERDLIDRVFEMSPVGLGILSSDGLERVNARAAEIYGAQTEDLGAYTVGEPAVYDVDGAPVPPADRPNARAFETGEPVTGWECQLRGVDGRRRWLSVSAAPLTDAAGDVERVVVATEDISRFKEQAVRLERRRDELAAELDDVLERVDDAFCALDGEFRFTYVNERARELLQVDTGELLGDRLWERYPEATETPVWDGLHEAVETGETTEFEVYNEGTGTWFHADVYPSETGVSVYFRDVTEQKRNERARRKSEERFRALMEHSPFSIQVFDASGQSIEANPAWERMWDTDREHLADYNILRDEQLEAAGVLSHVRDAFDGEAVTLPTIHYDPAEIGKPGRPRWVGGHAYPLVSKDGEPDEVAVVRQDVTDRKTHEAELDRYESIVETVDDGIYVVDPDGYLTLVNDAYAELTGYPTEQLIGMHNSELVDEETVERARAYEAELLAGEREAARMEADVRTADGQSVRAEGVFSIIEGDTNRRERVGVVRDVSERVARERELELYETIVSTVDDGIYVLDETFHFSWVNEAYAELTGYDRDELLGTHCSLVVDEEVAAESAAKLQAIMDGEATSATLEADLRRADGTRLRAESNFTVLAGDDANEDVKVGVVRDVSERVSREEELERRRERLAALNDLNRVVRALSEAAIDQSTRSEIEEAVCEGLAASDSLTFACIAEVDGEAKVVRSRTEAGPASLPNDGTVPLDLDDTPGSALVTRAVQTHEAQVVEDVRADSECGPLREYARERNLRSVAAVPIAHEGTLYGVLVVYADRPNAFTGGEGNAIGHLGDIVGHAISATEQRRALTSDEVIEMEFRFPDVFGEFDLPSSDGRITFDRAIPIGDDVFLEYGTVTSGMVETLDALVEKLPHWKSLEILDGDTDEGTARFELRLVAPPLLSSVAAIGGYVDQSALEDGDFRIRLHLAPGADVRHVIDVVKDVYPMAEMLSRRQVTKDPRAINTVSGILVEDLTERQLTALETAFFSGYFESPRPVSGDKLATSLGVSGPTFHHHLRNAQQTVLKHVLDE